MTNSTPPRGEPVSHIYQRRRLPGTRVSGDFRWFSDSLGVFWNVYDVRPSEVERRFHAGTAPDGLERRERHEFRVNLGADMAHGWLAFTSEKGEARRLAPIPLGWESMSHNELASLCTQAARLSNR